MSEFINTIDQLGDEVVLKSILERSVTEFKDDSLTKICDWAFGWCEQLKCVVLPNVTRIEDSAFAYCASLAKVDLSHITYINLDGFSNCNALSTLILRSNEVCTLHRQYSFVKFPKTLTNGTGYIYVPRALIEDYKVATVWVDVANQFRALEDYTVDGTTTGELDPTKI